MKKLNFNRLFSLIINNKVPKNTLKGENIQIMENTYISEDSIINDYVYIGNNCVVTKATIGRYTSIADNVTIGPGEHNFHKISTNSIFYEDAYKMLTSKKCIIGNDVWIGVDSIIRRGVSIGNGAVIGANSFVNRDVPDFAIVCGSPAKVIKYRFNKTVRRLITKTGWWNHDLEEAKIIIKKLERRVGTEK